MVKQCVVTGGAGFIGSHLVERLIRDGHRVAVVDSLATGRLENLVPVKGNPAVTFHKADVADVQALSPAMKGAQWVFHLAGLADIVPSIRQPLHYHAANVSGTIGALEAARAVGVERFVYAASSSCYGIPDLYPTPETAPAKPMYPYALTKYLGEQYVMHWGSTYQLPVVSMRLFNVYGPRSRTTGAYGAVFGVFLAQKVAGQPFTVVGDGSQTRDFTFVTDVADAFVTAAQSDVHGEIFNVGSGKTMSIKHLVELLGGPIKHLPKRPGEPDCTFADVSKIQQRLDWRASVPFEQGVRIMLENIQLWKDAPVWNEQSIAAATSDWFAHLAR
jgi:UDP-glucose 4-epimerase